jgi:hypothetical protein
MKKFSKSGIKTVLKCKYIGHAIPMNNHHFFPFKHFRGMHGSMLKAYQAFTDEILMTPTGEELILYLPPVSNPETRVNITPPYMFAGETNDSLLNNIN